MAIDHIFGALIGFVVLAAVAECRYEMRVSEAERMHDPITVDSRDEPVVRYATFDTGER